MRIKLGIRTAGVLTILLLAAGSLHSQTRVQGAVTGRWSPDGNPYIVERDAYVPNQRVLTLDPGVVVRLAAGVRFYVYGRLEAVGSEEDTIRFLRDGDGAWGGIRFIDPDELQRLIYCHISGGAANRGGQPADTVSSGGNIFVHRGSLLVRNSVIAGGECQGFGAGIALWGAQLQLDNSLIALNVTATQGGGLNVRSNAGAAVYKTAFIGNTAGWGGGGINVEEGGRVEVDSSLFHSNRAITGGGVALYGRSIEVRNTAFIENQAGMGGGAYVRNEGNSAQFVWCDFINNRADGNEGVGAGILSRFSVQLDVLYCRFIGNRAVFGGGGVWFQGPQRAHLDHILFLANVAGRTGGAVGLAADVGDQPVVFNTCTFLENRAEGGEHPAQIALVQRNSSLMINSSVLWGPSPFFSDCNRVSVMFSHTSEDIPGQGNRRENPRLFELDSTWALPRGDAPIVDSGDPNLPRDSDGTLPDRGWVHFPRNGWDGLESANILQQQAVGERNERPVRFTNRSGVPVYATTLDLWRDDGREVMFNLTNLIGDREITCAAWTEAGFLVAGGSNGGDPNRIYTLDRNLNLRGQFNQPGGVNGAGFLDFAYPGGEIIYAGDAEQIVEFTVDGELGDQFEGPDAVRTFRGVAVDTRYAHEDWDYWVGGDEGIIVRADWEFWEQERVAFPDTVWGLAMKGNMRALYAVVQRPGLAVVTLVLPDENRVIPLYPLIPPQDGARIGGIEVTHDWRDGRGTLVGVWKGEGNSPDYLFVSDLYTQWLAVKPDWKLLRPGQSAEWPVIFAGDVTGAGRHEGFLYLSLNGFGGNGQIRVTLIADPGAVNGTPAPSVPILLEAFPNPFNAALYLNWSLPRAAGARLTLVSADGRSVAEMPLAGAGGGGRFLFDAGELPAGVYYVRLINAGLPAAQRRVVLLK